MNRSEQLIILKGKERTRTISTSPRRTQLAKNRKAVLRQLFFRNCAKPTLYDVAENFKQKKNYEPVARMPCDVGKERPVSFWFKLKGAFNYGIYNWDLYKNDLSSIIASIQNHFYIAFNNDLETEIENLETHIAAVDAKRKMTELTGHSMDYLRYVLYEKYEGASSREKFEQVKDINKKADKLIEEYPVVLSTTFSSVSSLKGITYDYLIMDEGSQVDIATGVLALSCAKNAVIVGDLKQLPNVIKAMIKSNMTKFSTLMICWKDIRFQKIVF